MNDIIKEVLSLLRKERILITKMVKADEMEDKYLFNQLKDIYKDISIRTDNIISKLIKEDKYDELIEILSNRIDQKIDERENVEDDITLLGLLNTFHLNDESRKMYDIDSDVFMNELVLQIYEIYLWLMRNNDFSKELKDSIRTDLVMKLVNSRAIRKYFAGDYEETEIISNPLNTEDYNDRNRLGMAYSSMVIEKANLSNSFEQYKEIFDQTSFESRRKILEIEFAAISEILTKRGFLIPPNQIEYTDFTEDVIVKASNLVNEFRNRKENEQTKILIM